MYYQPKTKEQILKEQEERQKNLVWPSGIYPFRVISEATFGNFNVTTRDDVSRGGADMIVLVLQLENDKGGRKVIIDYLVEAIPEKLYSAAITCGLDYKSGQLFAHDFLGKEGYVEIGIEKGKPKKEDKSKNYPDKNRVITYVEENLNQEITPQEKHSQAKANAYVLDDEVPF